MATNTYVALDKVTTTGSVSSVTLNMGSTISQAYTDLILVINGIGSTAMDSYIQVNGDTGSNYSFTRLYGTGSAAGSDRGSSQTSIKAGNFSTSPNANIIHFMNYSNTTTYKTILLRSGDAGSGSAVITSAGLWRNTAAITSITLFTSAGTINSGATFSLYGIASEAAGAKATGGYITSDANYYYHTFYSTGTFTPLQSLSADILVVAGGGGGGNTGNQAGGGGAGGLLAFTSQALSATSYTCSVGAGGAVETVGVDSQFGALTLVKGGGRGAPGNGGAGDNGGAGGSGGGAANSGTGGSPQSGQGSAGANGGGGGTGAGGGGASATGTSGTSTTGGNGGNGSSAYSSWGAVTGTGENVSGTYYYAGGAGGTSYNAGAYPVGNGGYGGGGRSGARTGVANTGGGGCLAGGSGVVIVRYAK